MTSQPSNRSPRQTYSTRLPATLAALRQRRLAITDEASPFALLSTCNRPRTAVRRGAAWTAECHRGAAGSGHGQNCGVSVYRQAVLVADRRRRRLPRRLGRRSETGQRRRAGRECLDACYAVRRRPVPIVGRPLSGLAVPGPTVRVAGVHGPAVRCPAIRVSSRPGVQAVRCPAVRVSSHLVSVASALSESRSAVGSVRPEAGDAGGGLGRPAGQCWPRSGRVSLSCGCGRAGPADRRGGQAVARIARRSRPSQCRQRAEHDAAAPAAWLCALPSGAERACWLAVDRSRCGHYGPWSSSMPDAWVDRPGMGNRLDGERAVRPPGWPKQAASAAGWACTSSSSGAAFTPSLSSCALGQPRHRPSMRTPGYSQGLLGRGPS
jgi:hypothetical protein